MQKLLEVKGKADYKLQNTELTKPSVTRKRNYSRALGPF